MKRNTLTRKILKLTCLICFLAASVSVSADELLIPILSGQSIVKLNRIDSMMTPDEYESNVRYNKKIINKQIKRYFRGKCRLLGVPKEGVAVMSAIASTTTTGSTIYRYNEAKVTLKIDDAYSTQPGIKVKFSIDW